MRRVILACLLLASCGGGGSDPCPTGQTSVRVTVVQDQAFPGLTDDCQDPILITLLPGFTPTLVAHELAHALGAEHNDQPQTLMHPFIQTMDMTEATWIAIQNANRELLVLSDQDQDLRIAINEAMDYLNDRLQRVALIPGN